MGIGKLRERTWNQRALALMLVASALAACSHVDRRGEDDPSRTPGTTVPLGVEAQLLSAMLDGDCRTADASQVISGAARGRSVRAESMGGGARRMQRACEQSNVQLRFTTGPGKVPARIQLTSITVLDEATGRELEKLSARNPRRWDQASSTYVPWDLSLSPEQVVSTSFDLSAPDWDHIGGGSRWNTTNMSFRLSVGLTIDGLGKTFEIVLRSPFIAREPMMRT